MAETWTGNLKNKTADIILSEVENRPGIECKIIDRVNHQQVLEDGTVYEEDIATIMLTVEGGSVGGLWNDVQKRLQASRLSDS